MSTLLYYGTPAQNKWKSRLIYFFFVYLLYGRGFPIHLWKTIQSGQTYSRAWSNFYPLYLPSVIYTCGRLTFWRIVYTINPLYTWTHTAMLVGYAIQILVNWSSLSMEIYNAKITPLSAAIFKVLQRHTLTTIIYTSLRFTHNVQLCTVVFVRLADKHII